MAITETPVRRETVEEITTNWPDEPADIAETIIDRYGRPNEATESRLAWYHAREAPWKRTELYRDGVPHNFPKEHTDYLEQFIDYRVPPEVVDEITQFDGSVYVDRTKGELSAKCDQEPMNFLAINLAHDVAHRERSVDDAREKYATTALKEMMGGDPEYTQGLQFTVPTGDQGDPDETIVTDAMKSRIKEKLGADAEAAGNE